MYVQKPPNEEHPSLTVVQKERASSLDIRTNLILHSVYANFEEHLEKASKDCKNEKVKYYIDEMCKACKLYIDKTKNGLVSTSGVKAWTEYFESADVKGGSTVADLKDFMTSNAFDFKGYFNKKLNRRGDKSFREAMNTFLKKIDKSIDLNSGLPIFDVSRAFEDPVTEHVGEGPATSGKIDPELSLQEHTTRVDSNGHDFDGSRAQ
uniref:Uncharacterized protein n=1 Tax=Triparma pacifica TaxID=91992 RepID=A0A7S2QV72_9STRA